MTTMQCVRIDLEVKGDASLLRKLSSNWDEYNISRQVSIRCFRHVDFFFLFYDRHFLCSDALNRITAVLGYFD